MKIMEQLDARILFSITEAELWHSKKIIWDGAEAESVADQYIVTLDTTPDLDNKASNFSKIASVAIDEVLKKAPFGVSFGEYLGTDRIFTIRLSQDVDQQNLEKYFSKISDFASIEPDLVGHTASISVSDPLYSNQLTSHLNVSNVNPAGTGAWNLTEGSNSTAVAVLDSGINFNHADLSANMWTGSSGEHGIDYINSGTTPLDENGHGTNVAGILAAVGNSTGVTGVLRKGSLISVRVTDQYQNYIGSPNSIDPTPAGQAPRPNTYLSNVVAGINYVCSLNENGVNVRVINASLGISKNYPGVGTSYVSSMETALNRAKNDDIMVVVAALNNGTSLEAKPIIPASFSDAVYNLPNVITVGATVASGNELASFSNYSTSKVELSAPGVSIYTTLYEATVHNPVRLYGNQQDYYGWDDVTAQAFLSQDASINGTSMATPQVAGTIALMLSLNPDLTITNIRDALRLTVTPPATGTYTRPLSLTEWGGRLNVSGAVNYVKVHFLPASYDYEYFGDPDGNPTIDTIRLTVSGSNIVVTNTASSETLTVPNLATTKIAIYGLGAADDIRVVNTPSVVLASLYIDSGLGDDIIYGSQADDTLIGGDGDDSLVGDAGADTIVCGLGNDTVDGSAGNDTIRGGDGNDQLLGGKHNDVIYGDNDIDEIYGYEGADSIRGGASGDNLNGSRPDTVTLGAGNDTIFGDSGNDTIRGGVLADLLWGDSDDTTSSGAGIDRLWGYTGADSLHGGAQIDIFYTNLDATVVGDSAIDVLYSSKTNGTNETLYWLSSEDTQIS